MTVLFGCVDQIPYGSLRGFKVQVCNPLQVFRGEFHHPVEVGKNSPPVAGFPLGKRYQVGDAGVVAELS